MGTFHRLRKELVCLRMTAREDQLPWIVQALTSDSSTASSHHERAGHRARAANLAGETRLPPARARG